MPAFPTIAEIPILYLLLMAIAVLTMLGLAFALGFFIARRYYRKDATESATIDEHDVVHQNEHDVVHEKGRTSTGGSEAMLLRGERDRVRYNVERTARLVQAAQSSAEGRPTDDIDTPVSALRPMSLEQHELSGRVHEAESSMSKVRQTAQALFGIARRQPKQQDNVAELFDERALPVETATSANPAGHGVDDLDRVGRPQPSPLAARLARSQATPRNVAVPPPASRFVPESANAPLAHMMPASFDHHDTARVPGAARDEIAYEPPAMGAPVVPAAHPVPAARPVVRSEPTAAPAAAPAPGARASSSDLKRRLAQVRERSAAQRAQLEELRKTS